MSKSVQNVQRPTAPNSALIARLIFYEFFQRYSDSDPSEQHTELVSVKYQSAIYAPDVSTAFASDLPLPNRILTSDLSLPNRILHVP